MPQHLCYERRMQRTRQVCRQLNSEGIKSTALCYLTPVIGGRCSIITAKCVCKVKDKPRQRRGQPCNIRLVFVAIRRFHANAILKNILVQKFDAFYLSNTAGIHNVAFFFSVIASQEKKKAVSMRTQTRRVILKLKFPALFPNNGSRAFNERKQITLPCYYLPGRVDYGKRCIRQPNFCAQSLVEFRTGSHSNTGN